MIFTEIINKATGEKMLSFQQEEFNEVNPVEFFRDDFVVKQMVLKGISVSDLLAGKRTEESERIFAQALRNWRNLFSDIEATPVPDNLMKVLSATRKREQVKLLKGITLTPDILIAFYVRAYKEQDFTLSGFSAEHHNKGLEGKKKPLAWHIGEGGEVEVFGKTKLSDGQLKQGIQHKRMTVVKFLTKGDNWHCFFVTYKSLRGEEPGNQPHFHYVSSLFGISKEKLINELKAKKYSLPSLPHITLKGYGNQPEE